ncbi:endonuclease/exonuclease/phosphatase family protein [Gramella sp. GC03-9]|uniref:Endonuclease/exonuclease/phosphatase family protein n=1 Tax=Christiangramia oceanisediminis TaxID=2920386 RepID=A0A9X2KWG4_9FLAO|nr:endonuclease/exonuclease/phosphatase family protein [Gramella oceanisediminis]
MFIKAIGLLFILPLICNSQERRNYEIQTVAFYNVENLFDTEDNPDIFDDDRSATGKDKWDEQKYRRKIDNISRVISEIGTDQAGQPPVVIGLCEVENIQVLEDLVSHPNLLDFNYGIIHFDSPDERGIDVALLYRKQVFRPLEYHPRKLLIYESDKAMKRDYTRDQLVVTGLLNNEEISFIVNHWPSRGGGEARSAYKREKAAFLNLRIIDSIKRIDPESRIISMGDFNDDPSSKSFKKILKTQSKNDELGNDYLFNPMENMLKNGQGSLAYRDTWNLFDQFFMTSNLTGNSGEGWQFYKAGIFKKPYLETQTGQFKGYPRRTYGYSGYEGGYSDHFPVYIYLIRPVDSD